MTKEEIMYYYLGCTKTNTSGLKSDGIIYLKELGKMSP